LVARVNCEEHYTVFREGLSDSQSWFTNTWCVLLLSWFSICLNCLGTAKRRSTRLPNAKECSIERPFPVFGGTDKSRTKSRTVRRARLKPVAEIERRRIQQRKQSTSWRSVLGPAIGWHTWSHRLLWVVSNYGGHLESNAIVITAITERIFDPRVGIATRQQRRGDPMDPVSQRASGRSRGRRRRSRPGFMRRDLGKRRHPARYLTKSWFSTWGPLRHFPPR